MLPRKQPFKRVFLASDNESRVLLAGLLQIDLAQVGVAPHAQSRQENTALDSGTLTPPDSIIRDMYLEITNISQGLNIGLLVIAIADDQFYQALAKNYYSAPLLAATSLLISIIFWNRYYFDTHILRRSYTLVSMLLFFGYVVAQAVSFSVISYPLKWFISTGIFILFAVGFYAYNLLEIRRKQRLHLLPAWSNYVQWQRKRLIDMIVLTIVAFLGAWLLIYYPSLALLEAILALTLAIWQAKITGDYRKYRFLKTGA